jgi:hypothetical protein
MMVMTQVWEVVTLARLAAVVAGGAVVGVLVMAVWRGWERAQVAWRRRRKGVWVVTCPATAEAALVVREGGRVRECSLGGSYCEALCLGRKATVGCGIFDTVKLLKFNE